MPIQTQHALELLNFGPDSEFTAAKQRAEDQKFSYEKEIKK